MPKCARKCRDFSQSKRKRRRARPRAGRARGGKGRHGERRGGATRDARGLKTCRRSRRIDMRVRVARRALKRKNGAAIRSVMGGHESGRADPSSRASARASTDSGSHRRRGGLSTRRYLPKPWPKTTKCSPPCRPHPLFRCSLTLGRPRPPALPGDRPPLSSAQRDFLGEMSRTLWWTSQPFRLGGGPFGRVAGSGRSRAFACVSSRVWRVDGKKSLGSEPWSMSYEGAKFGT